MTKASRIYTNEQTIMSYCGCSLEFIAYTYTWKSIPPVAVMKMNTKSSRSMIHRITCGNSHDGFR